MKKFVFLAVLVSLFMLFSLSPAVAEVVIDPVSPHVCGDGVVSGPEDCDPSAPGGGDASCCNSNCEVENLSCGDADFCNGEESCNASGSCESSSDPCIGQVCNEGTDSCDSCQTDGECDDSNPCTDDTCEAGSCVNDNNSDPCDDENACTTNDTCSEGACTPGGKVLCAGDINPCTDTTCDPVEGCMNVNNNSNECDNEVNDICTDADSCVDGECVGSNPSDDACSISEVCDEVSGCVPAEGPDDGASVVPTMNEWGMILFLFLAGIISVFYLRRQRN